jgi:hypothetical protein
MLLVFAIAVKAVNCISIAFDITENLYLINSILITGY